MSVTRNLAIADLDTQIQQAALLQQAGNSGFTGVAGVRGAQTVKVGDRTTSQYPTERLFEPQGEPTLRLVEPNPYIDAPLLPLAPGEVPPPPPNAQRDAQRRAQQEQRNAAQQTQDILRGVAGGMRMVALGLRNYGHQANRRLGAIPTPGDVWTPFFILLFLFLIMIPVKGHTRLMWLWLVIIGHAAIGSPFQSVSSAFESGAGQTVGQGQTLIGGTLTTTSSSSTSTSSSSSSGSGQSIITLPTNMPTLPIVKNYMSMINSGVND